MKENRPKYNGIRNYDHPERSIGTIIGEQIRARCNLLTREERQRLLEEGMKRIYKGRDSTS